MADTVDTCVLWSERAVGIQDTRHKGKILKRWWKDKVDFRSGHIQADDFSKDRCFCRLCGGMLDDENLQS